MKKLASLVWLHTDLPIAEVRPTIVVFCLEKLMNDQKEEICLEAIELICA